MPFITVPPQSDAVMERGSVEFSCFAAGTPAPSIVWRFQEHTVGTGNTLTIGIYIYIVVQAVCYTIIIALLDNLLILFWGLHTDNVDSSKEGNYSCVAVNTAGRTSQDTNLIVFGKYRKQLE